MPLLSIITISFNNLEDVITTCKSVDDQILLPNEHIIIDGSTKPDIKNHLHSNPQPAYRKWICEPDNGIADAFNKGINNTTGEIILLLNSGDQLYDNSVLGKIKEVFEGDKELMWCHGKLNVMRGGIWVVVGKPFEKKKLYRGMRGTFHPTMYVKRVLYEKHGLFDTSIKMAMDYDFLCRIADEKNVFINHPLATFDPTGVTSTKYLDAMNETYAVYEKHFGKNIKQTFWKWRLALLHYLLESKLGKGLYKIKAKLGFENV
ncbi:MAG TPA: glycosyltransferase [Flavipsychrobacter sp.]|nr:glycosyltransferase [Flavipsychrobacter sp.]